MFIPRGIKAFGVNWKVILASVSQELDFKYLGKVNYNEVTITLAIQKEIIMRKTLLHELIHIADKHAEIGLSEEQVVRLENSLFALIQDNQEIFTWIRKGDSI